jgi:hypothetical protein
MILPCSSPPRRRQRRRPMLILVVALVGFGVAYFVVGPGKPSGPKRHADIPLAMRPYHSDEELETTAWSGRWPGAWPGGVRLAVPPAVLADRADRINNASTTSTSRTSPRARRVPERLRLLPRRQPRGGLGAAPGPGDRRPWPAPALDNIVARYQDSEIVDRRPRVHPADARPRPRRDADEGLRRRQRGVSTPTTSSTRSRLHPVGADRRDPRGAGLRRRSREEDLFAANCARCHGPNAEGYVGPQLLERLRALRLVR